MYVMYFHIKMQTVKRQNELILSRTRWQLLLFLNSINPPLSLWSYSINYQAIYQNKWCKWCNGICCTWHLNASFSPLHELLVLHRYTRLTFDVVLILIIKSMMMDQADFLKDPLYRFPEYLVVEHLMKELRFVTKCKNKYTCVL